MRAHTMLRTAALVAVTLFAATTGLWAFCDSAIESYAVFQCADLGYFAPVPAGYTPSQIQAVFWQIGFGNNTLNSGQGTDGTGVQSKSNFNGNDNGLFKPDVADACARFCGNGFPFPQGSICLASNNWANTGIDGCCDDTRSAVAFSYYNSYTGYGPYNYPNDDNYLNPYLALYFKSIGYPGYLSYASIQDYPMAVLLKTPDQKFFAIAAVNNMDRGNTGGLTGSCNMNNPGTNPAACDVRQGFYQLKDIKNGMPNAVRGSGNDVVPWQTTPNPLVSVTAGDPNDPNSILTLNLSWTAVTIYSDQHSMLTNNPTMATKDASKPRDPNAATGVGVPDVAAKWGLAHYRIDVAATNDPNFTMISQSTICPGGAGCTSATTATIMVPATDCVRLTTLFGVLPRETVNTNATNCRLGKCGDIGYFVTGTPFCPGSATCTPTAELCNGLDDDCDGVIDNGFNLGSACDGVGQCGAGVLQCKPGDPNTTICSTDPNGSMSQVMPELCDGLDNNCDGVTDDGFNLGATCTGTGQCAFDPNGNSLMGTLECDASDPNMAQCSTNPGGSQDQSKPELCGNNLDDNCDGMTDEGFNLGAACTGQGQCGAGIFECAGGAQICSTQPGGSQDQSTPEICDAVDNNCNGTTDEGFNLGQSCPGQGQCGPGVLECDAADPNMTICSTLPGGSMNQATPEICDGVDNNCDGTTDEGFNLGAACTGTGACGAGTLECSPTDPNGTICSTDPGGSMDQSVMEICGNGIDDDCDGLTDEAGGPEICDGIDNNCDGQTDEGFNIGGACTAPGVCGPGTLECNAADPNQAICSTGPGGSMDRSSGEKCNGLDDNCNGTTDEGFNLGSACTGMGVCGAGVLECSPTNPQGTVCSTSPGGSMDQSSPEVCDGQDNNCNGTTDEGFNIGAACTGVGQCGVDPNGGGVLMGAIECSSPTTTVCSIDPGGSMDRSMPEICNGLDDNCNGQVDEGNACPFEISSPVNGATLDCRQPKMFQPRITWQKNNYDVFRPQLSWDPTFKQKVQSYVNLETNYWEPNGSKWNKACKKATQLDPNTPMLYIRVIGQDLDLPKKDPNRTATTDVVTVTSTPFVKNK